MASESSSSSTSVRQKRPLDNSSDSNDDTNQHTTGDNGGDDTHGDNTATNTAGGNSAKRSRVDNEATATPTASEAVTAAAGNEDEAEFDENAAVEGLGDVTGDDGKGEDDSKEETIEMRSLIESHQVHLNSFTYHCRCHATFYSHMVTCVLVYIGWFSDWYRR